MSKVIVGTGSFLPEKVVTNDDIEAQVVDFDREKAGCTLHEWTLTRLGVESRRHANVPYEGTSDMALAAARRALEDAQVDAAELDLIVLGTFTSDYRLPSSVSILQAGLNTDAKCFQLESACAGFVDATITAGALMDAMGYRTALVVHSEVLSQHIDPSKFMNMSIFGDGAGAVVLRDLPDSPYGVVSQATYTDGSIAHWTLIPNGTKAPVTHEGLDAGAQYLEVDFNNTFEVAAPKMADVAREVVKLSDISLDDVDVFIPHQASRNIIAGIARELELPLDRFVITMEDMGNTSGAGIPIALDRARRSGRLEHGQSIVLTSVGGGIAWGGIHMIWADPETLRAESAAL